MLISKKKIFILALAVITLLLIFFVFNYFNSSLLSQQKQIGNVNQLVSSSSEVTSLSSSDNATSTIVSDENTLINTNNLKQDQENRARYLEELKVVRPQYSAEQLALYFSKAEKKEMQTCRGLTDETDCIFATAFIARIPDFCGEISNQKTKIECSNILLNERATAEISKCRSLVSDDAKALCLANLFINYQQIKECSTLTESIKEVCMDSINYRQALDEHNFVLCYNINEEILKGNCLGQLAPEARDSDKDGLNDIGEANIYHTDPNNPDTDGDGFTDGNEVKNGFNPAGSGLLVK